MSELEAVFQQGVFKPLTHVSLPENQRVRLSVHPIEAADVNDWLNGIQRVQRRIAEERGCFPDSTADIAADRAR